MHDEALVGAEEDRRQDDGGLDVLITSTSLAHLSGAYMYARDLALELDRTGHCPVVYTPRPGVVADELSAAGIRVVGHLDELDAVPDVVHVNQTPEAYEAALHFPGIPMVFVSHGLGWMAEPPRLAGVGVHVAVGRSTFDRLLAAGVPEASIRLIPNGVDTVRFRPSGRALPDRPQRALVFSNNAAESGYLELVRAACARRGISVDVRGQGVGDPLVHPEEVLPDYDLVFARGRCAREAMACGCGLVLLDIEGMASFVEPDQVVPYDRGAFGVSTLTRPHDVDAIGAEIDRWDATAVRAASGVLRREGSLERMVGRLVAAYQASITEVADVEPDPVADLAAVRRYLPVLAELGLERDEALLAKHLLHQHALHLEARVNAAEPALREARADLDAVRADLAATEAALAELQGTRVVRARDKALGSGRVGRALRALYRPFRR